MAEQPQRHEPDKEHEHEGVLPHGDKEHGEGNYEAAHHYQEGVQRTLEDKDIERLADEAKEALEGDEGEELKAAEEEGKRHIAEEDPGLYRKGKQGQASKER